MNIVALCMTGVLLAVLTTFAHYIDNIRNTRSECTKYYMKRASLLSVLMIFVLFVSQKQPSSSSGGAYSPSMATGVAPF